MSLIWVYFTPSVITLTCYRMLCGISNTVAFLTCLKVISKLFVGKKLNIVSSTVIAFAMLGGLFQSLLNIGIINIGWQNSLLSVILYGFICYLLILFSLDSNLIKNNSISNMMAFHKIRIVIKTILVNPINWQCGLYTGLLNLPVTLLAATWGSFYLTQAKHLSMTQANTLISMIFIGMIIGSPLVGWISMRLLSRKNTMILGAGLILLTTLLILFNLSQSIVEMATLFFLLGMFSTAQILSYPIVTEGNSLAYTGTAMSFISILIYLIGAACNSAFGFLISLPNNAVNHAFMLLPFTFLIAFGIAFFSKFKATSSNQARLNMETH